VDHLIDGFAQQQMRTGGFGGLQVGGAEPGPDEGGKAGE
jgi:hypothetical protein